MSKHYTDATLEDTVFCKTCNAKTRHTVSARKLGYCIPCFDRRQLKEAERKAEHEYRLAHPEPPAPKQESLFA